MEPNSITVDFERCNKYYRRSFSNSNISGCFYPFVQCLWRKIHSFGRPNWYNDPRNSFLLKIKSYSTGIRPKDGCHRHISWINGFISWGSRWSPRKISRLLWDYLVRRCTKMRATPFKFWYLLMEYKRKDIARNTSHK